jgi:hypothetical protein
MHGEVSADGTGQNILKLRWSFVRNGWSYFSALIFVALFIFSSCLGSRKGHTLTALINAWGLPGALTTLLHMAWRFRGKHMAGLMTSEKFDVKLSSLRHTFVFEPHILGERRLAMKEGEWNGAKAYHTAQSINHTCSISCYGHIVCNVTDCLYNVGL